MSIKIKKRNATKKKKTQLFQYEYLSFWAWYDNKDKIYV